MFEAIFNFLDHSLLPWGASLLILTWGVSQWIAMRRRFLGPLHRQLLAGIQALEATPAQPVRFYGAFSQVDQALAENSLLSEAWAEYGRVLIAPEERGAILGTRSPGCYFSLEKLTGDDPERHYFRAVPGLLLGAGMFVTLLGLVAAIYFSAAAMATADVELSRTALLGLLQITSFKLLSSLSGFLAAMLFSWP